jgi:hypothetical protein
MMLGIALPTRHFGAALTALGYVLAEPTEETTSVERDAHFRRIAALPLGTPLMYLNGDEMYRGPLLSVTNVGGEDFVVIRTGKTKQFVPKRRALQIELAEMERRTFPEDLEGGRLHKPKAFVQHFYSHEEFYKINRSSSRHLAIIGALSRLRAELVQTPFLIPDNPPAEGTLQDLLRVAKFTASGVGYRMAVYPVSKGSSPDPRGVPPRLVIYDGAASFLKWAHQFTSAHSLVLLDRTELDFPEAVDALNLRYLSRVAECSLPAAIQSPAGVDIISYWEPTR